MNKFFFIIVLLSLFLNACSDDCNDADCPASISGAQLLVVDSLGNSYYTKSNFSSFSVRSSTSSIPPPSLNASEFIKDTSISLIIPLSAKQIVIQYTSSISDTFEVSRTTRKTECCGEVSTRMDLLKNGTIVICNDCPTYKKSILE